MQTDETRARMRSGQILIMVSIAVGVLALSLIFVAPYVGNLTSAFALILALVGVLRLASGLRYPVKKKVFFVVLTLTPVIGFFTLLALITRATEALENAEGQASGSHLEEATDYQTKG